MNLLGKHILRICFGYGMFNKPCSFISCFCPSQKSAECFLLLQTAYYGKRILPTISHLINV